MLHGVQEESKLCRPSTDIMYIYYVFLYICVCVYIPSAIGVCDLKSSETMDLSCLPYNTLSLKDSGDGEIVCDAEMNTALLRSKCFRSISHTVN
jgi:hypothetical protein